MKAIKLTDDKYAIVDGERVGVISKSGLEDNKKHLEAQLDTIPSVPTDRELLTWAKENYPQLDDAQVSKTRIQAELDSINVKLDLI